MVESLRKQIEELEADIAELEEKIRTKKAEKATAASQVQARIFLERIFAPYMEGICDVRGLSPEEGLRILINEEDTLDRIASNNREALTEFLSQPEVRVIVAIARPLGDVSDEWIKEKIGVLLEVMGKIRPELANVIMTTPGGQRWFHDSLIGLRNILFGKPQINIEKP
ncbi:unnamed protein product [marine sediment metagenome]|uniref:Uncharacterized protein n=1 Tax=marine sediment metagenome TaxID=412755 RepID=X1FIY1_9ZZZZ